jgi:hypothetical protein
MSYTYLLEQGEESSAESFSAIPASVLSRLNLTAEKSCCNGSETESCRSSQSGMISEPSTENLGAGKLTLSAEAFPARTSASPVLEKESPESDPDYGQKWPEWLARFDPNTSSWKTRQCSLFGGWEAYSETWPEWGMMRRGACWAVKTSGQRSNAKESGYWPAMTCNGWRSEGSIRQLRKLVEIGVTTEAEAQAMSGGSLRPERMEAWQRPCEEAAGGRMNPAWGEWLMGWPMTWTGLQPLETVKFQQWLHWHGIS